MKTKEPAKKRLLAAFSANGTIVVPEKIIKLEEALRMEYDQANELAKQRHEEEEELRRIDEERKRKQRKRDYDTLMQEFVDIDVSDVGLLHGVDESESASNEISQVELHDAIAALPEKQLRKILVKLVDDIPELERAMRLEIGKLQLSEDDGAPATSKKATKSKGKGKGKETVCTSNCSMVVGVLDTHCAMSLIFIVSTIELQRLCRPVYNRCSLSLR